MAKEKQLLLAYYGDDFTGSTDALEFLSRAGIKTVLFINAPSKDRLRQYEGLQAIGIAGMSRSMKPDDMGKELKEAFSALKKSGARHVHYKVCSTFDSSPEIGSIGKATDIGAKIFENSFIPLLVAAPKLGRYCAFGNLFAQMGIGSKGEVFRLDRHPSISHHPLTPMKESNLALHLSKQTTKNIGLFNLLDVDLPKKDAEKALKNIQEKGSEVILFDAVYQNQMAKIGSLIDSQANSTPFFSVGSSGIEMALGEYWQETGKLQRGKEWNEPGEVNSVLVGAGSCSPVSREQVAFAISQGFGEIALETYEMVKTNDLKSLLSKYVSEAVLKLKEGKSVIIHTNCADEPEKEKVLAYLKKSGFSPEEIRDKTAKLYGESLGEIIKQVVLETKLQRVVVAGGDTSGFAAKALEIEALEMIAPLSPGAPLCKIHSENKKIDGLEINFKGGQVGDEDYFEVVRSGKYLSN